MQLSSYYEAVNLLYPRYLLTFNTVRPYQLKQLISLPNVLIPELGGFYSAIGVTVVIDYLREVYRDVQFGVAAGG